MAWHFKARSHDKRKRHNTPSEYCTYITALNDPPLDSIGKMKRKITCFIRRTSIAGSTDMDVQVYSSKEKASVIVDGKVVRDDPVMRVNGLLCT